MSQSVPHIQCINPDCHGSTNQPWGNNFCQNCGTPLKLNQRYIPIKRLGSGGFAAIYTVWDLTTQTERVLKVLLETSPKALELFEQEASVLASLHHPGIPAVEPDSYFRVETRKSRAFQEQIKPKILPCLVMEKVNGKTLQEILSENRDGCPNEWVKSWFNQALDILEVLHKKNIIHRDIKPSNLMLIMPKNTAQSQDPFINEAIAFGQLVAIDFGGAKQIGSDKYNNGSSTRIFSPGYSPPEQLTGGFVGPGTDFYALGKTLIHLLTGRYPSDLEDQNTGKIRWRHLTTIPPNLADIIDDMIRVDIHQRPRDVTAIKNRLEKVVGNHTPTQILPISAQAWQGIVLVITNILQHTGKITVGTVRFILNLVLGCLHTIWALILGGMGGITGSLIGLFLYYWTPLGSQVSHLVDSILFSLIPSLNIPNFNQNASSAILIFGLAGIGTAVGLSEAGGFSRNRNFIIASLMGGLGYILGWVFWQIAELGQTNYTANGLIGLGAIATGLLTLGLGWRDYRLVYPLVVADGAVATLVLLALSFPDIFNNFLLLPQKQITGAEILPCLGFFGLLGCIIGFFLGISHYIIIPILKLLGWR